MGIVNRKDGVIKMSIQDELGTEEDEKVEEKKEAVEDEFEWEKDDFADQDAEVIKLDVGQSIAGVLMDKFDSVKFGCGIYKIKVKDDDKQKVILGTTLLDKMLANRSIGDVLKIERLPDQKSGSGRTYQVFEVFHPKKDE
jgi:hypothetical protein